MKTTPAVFAVGREYQIMVPVSENSLFWIETGGESFYDEQNGIMRSICSTHRVIVPMEVLDRAGEYTVCEREIIDRKPYFPETAETKGLPSNSDLSRKAAQGFIISRIRIIR